MKTTSAMRKAYSESLDKHIKFVIHAGSQLGLSKIDLAVHDASKYTHYEFDAYAAYFYDDDGNLKNPEDRTREEIDAFQLAWLHHLHNNDHHWQYWIVPGNEDGGVLEMTESAALEMVADWMGASKAYTGSWNMTNWLIGNSPEITLHPKTKGFVTQVLVERLNYKLGHICFRDGGND